MEASAGYCDSDDGTSAVKFTSVGAKDDHTCWVRTDGSVDCWGDDQEEGVLYTVGFPGITGNNSRLNGILVEGQ